MSEKTVEEITSALAAPFDADEVKFKPGATSGNRAMAIAYIDARAVMDRLDETVGPANWQDEYEPHPGGTVLCRLRLRIGGEWLTKQDVGGESEQKDEGDRHKAAVSDALKRAAVKWGIGRFLYRLPAQWCDYDPQRRQFVNPPKLPGAAPAKAPAKVAPPKDPKAKSEPRTLEEFRRWLSDLDAYCLKGRWIGSSGELLKAVQDEAQEKFGVAEAGWTLEVIPWGVQYARGLAERLKAKKAG